MYIYAQPLKYKGGISKREYDAKVYVPTKSGVVGASTSYQQYNRRKKTFESKNVVNTPLNKITGSGYKALASTAKNILVNIMECWNLISVKIISRSPATLLENIEILH